MPCAHPITVKVEAAYDAVADLRYTGLVIDGNTNKPVAYVAWCTICGALGIAPDRDKPYRWTDASR